MGKITEVLGWERDTTQALKNYTHREVDLQKTEMKYGYGRVIFTEDDFREYNLQVLARENIINSNTAKLAAGAGPSGYPIGGEPIAGGDLETVPAEITYNGDNELVFRLFAGKGYLNDRADQYDLTAGGGSFSNIIQPGILKNVVLLLTDVDESITAMSVTVTGTLFDGSTDTETYTGITATQEGTTPFKTITSITISSVTGAAAGDTLDVSYGILRFVKEVFDQKPFAIPGSYRDTWFERSVESNMNIQEVAVEPSIKEIMMYKEES